MTALLHFCFRLHDSLSDFLAKHSIGIKRVIVGIAIVFLFGIFYPESRKSLGEWALDLLFFILFLSPLSKIFRMRLLILLMGFRRQFGILFASLVIAHSLSLLLDPVWFSVNIVPFIPNHIFSIPSRFLLGLAAFTLTLPLLLTSNTLANRLLGANWKRLHTLVYPLFILAVFHKVFIGPAGRGVHSVSGAWAEALFLLGSYGFLKLLVWKNFLLPLNRLIESVGNRYRAFRALPADSKLPL